jgi:hypothetical protein
VKLLHQYAYRFPRQSSQLEIDLSNSCGLEKPVEVCNLPAISSLRTEGEQGNLFCERERATKKVARPIGISWRVTHQFSLWRPMKIIVSYWTWTGDPGVERPRCALQSSDFGGRDPGVNGELMLPAGSAWAWRERAIAVCAADLRISVGVDHGDRELVS